MILLIFKRAGFYIILTLSILLFFAVISNLLPENPLIKNNNNFFQQLAPQGFSFFSKDPRDETFFIESASENSWDIQLPTSILSNLFGIKRTGRAQGVEVGQLLGNFPEEKWTACHSMKECDEIKSDLNINVVEEPESFKFIRGTYIITVGEPISWFWTDFKETTTFDRRIIKVEVK